MYFKDTIIGHLEKLAKIYYYFGGTLKLTNKQDWIINPFVVSNFPELPLRVAEEYTEMTAKLANQSAFNSLKEKHSKVSGNIFIWGSNAFNLSLRLRVCN